jgi:hypothetical protein
MKSRKNALTCYVRWDLDESGKLIIENEDFESRVEEALAKGNELTFTFVNRKTGFADSMVDAIVNQFVKDCQNEDPKRYHPYTVKPGYEEFGAVFLAFLNNLFRHLAQRGKTILAPEKDNFADFDIFPVNRKGRFDVSVPFNLWDRSRQRGSIVFGPDNLFRVFSEKVIFEYILPAYYVFLFETNRLGRVTSETNLSLYIANFH